MTLVSPPQSNPGDEITADAINDPVNALAAVVNGQIDDTNIAGVSGSKLSNGTVTSNKLSTAPGELGGEWNTWNPTITGFSSVPGSSSYRYMKVGKTVKLAINQGTNGTSNSTAFTISLPFPAATITNMTWATNPALVVDNGAFSVSELGIGFITSGASVLTISKNVNGLIFTASGGKRITQMFITYEAV